MAEKAEELTILKQFVDYLLPELAPYEVVLYLFLLRNSWFENGEPQYRIGKRGISEKLGRGAKGKQMAYEHVTKTVTGLEDMGCIKIKDLSREGYLHEVVLPADVPIVAEKLAVPNVTDEEEDWFNTPDKRLQLIERDRWTCQYCGEAVDKGNVTLDHFIPQSKGGGNNKENLRTSCLACNSIKSGKSFEEAAPLILLSMSKRRTRRDT